MFKLMNKKMKNKKGFTLIELVVVIAILGILAAIAVPRLLGFQQRAEEQADKQSAVQVRNALSLLHANSEIDFDTAANNGSALVVTIAADVSGGAGFALTAIDQAAAAATFADVVDTAVADIQTDLYQLIGNIDKKGTGNIVVNMTKEGTVTVVSP